MIFFSTGIRDFSVAINVVAPTHLWPLSDNTCGLEVSGQTPAHLTGAAYAEGVPGLGYTAFSLGAGSSVSVPINGQLNEDRFSVLAYFYMSLSQQTGLYRYADVDGTLVFDVVVDQCKVCVTSLTPGTKCCSFKCKMDITWYLVGLEGSPGGDINILVNAHGEKVKWKKGIDCAFSLWDVIFPAEGSLCVGCPESRPQGSQTRVSCLQLYDTKLDKSLEGVPLMCKADNWVSNLQGRPV